jgi:hypothetical protein
MSAIPEYTRKVQREFKPVASLQNKKLYLSALIAALFHFSTVFFAFSQESEQVVEKRGNI